jgi:hypothetical protein
MKKNERTNPHAVVLKVTTGLRAGRLSANHNRRATKGSAARTVVLKVTTGLRAGRLAGNHNRRVI